MISKFAEPIQVNPIDTFLRQIFKKKISQIVKKLSSDGKCPTQCVPQKKEIKFLN